MGQPRRVNYVPIPKFGREAKWLVLPSPGFTRDSIEVPDESKKTNFNGKALHKFIIYSWLRFSFTTVAFSKPLKTQKVF